MAMDHHARMAGRNRNVVGDLLRVSFVALSVLCGYALGFATSQDSSSSQTTHRKPAQNTRRTTVSEAEAPSPELTKAEGMIQAKNYAEAESLLRKAVETDPRNYVAWFDLGFVENALGKTDDSIAAYRKSVSAKPDVLESNLNLGLQLAKAGQPDADQFLRAATQLKATSHAGEGKSRAWISLAHV